MELSTRDRIIKTIDHYATAKPDDYIDEAKLWDDLGLDSLDLIEAVIDLEEEFDIELEDEEIDALSTFADLVNLIHRQIS